MSLSMQMQELGKSIDQVLSAEFDALILEEFCSIVTTPIHLLRTSHEYNLDVTPAAVARIIDIYTPQRVCFRKVVSGEGHDEPAHISIFGPGNSNRYSYSVNQLCAIFYPEARFRVKDDWKNSLQLSLKILTEDLFSLYQRDIVVSIANRDPRNPPFWELKENIPRLSFYTQCAAILKFVVTKRVSDIAISARQNSDSPYQRFMNTEHWGLLSFRIGKRQQVEIVQYTDAKRIRMKCALVDLGFLENGYGKVARIRELVSTDIPSNGTPENIETSQEEFVDRVLKQLATIETL